MNFFEHIFIFIKAHWKEIIPILSPLLVLLLVFLMFWLLKKIFAKKINTFLEVVSTNILNEKTTLSSVVFLFFCVLTGVFSGCCLSIPSFYFAWHFILMRIFTGYNFLYPLTLVTFQFATCAFFFFSGKGHPSGLVFSLSDFIEVFVLKLYSKKRPLESFFIGMKFVFSVVLSLIIIAIKILQIITKELRPEGAARISGVPFLAVKEPGNFWSAVQNLFSLKLTQLKIFSFLDFLDQEETLFLLNIFRSWVLLFYFARLFNFFGVRFFINPPRKFYYIGTIICIIGFSIAFFLKNFLFSFVFFNFFLNFAAIFAVLGCEIIIVNFSILPFIFSMFFWNNGLFLPFFFHFFIGVLNPIFRWL